MKTYKHFLQESNDTNKKIEHHEIEVYYDNGDILTTEINGTHDEIVKYYIGRKVADEDFETGKETFKKAIKVKFLS